MLDDVRQRGAARVVDTLLPGIVGFCVPVFDSDGHIALGIVALGPTGSFDPEWDGAVDRPLRAAAAPAVQRPGVRGVNPARRFAVAAAGAGGCRAGGPSAAAAGRPGSVGSWPIRSPRARFADAHHRRGATAPAAPPEPASPPRRRRSRGRPRTAAPEAASSSAASAQAAAAASAPAPCRRRRRRRAARRLPPRGRLIRHPRLRAPALQGLGPERGTCSGMEPASCSGATTASSYDATARGQRALAAHAHPAQHRPHHGRGPRATALLRQGRSEQATHFQRDKGKLSLQQQPARCAAAAGRAGPPERAAAAGCPDRRQTRQVPPGTRRLRSRPRARARPRPWIFTVEGEEQLQLAGRQGAHAQAARATRARSSTRRSNSGWRPAWITSRCACV